MSALEKSGLTDKTVVVFTSDNGGLLRSTYNIGMRAGKGSAYEGGVRVPLIVCWPRVTHPGATTATQVITPDLYPTLLHACNGKPATGQILDGVDIMPALRGGTLKPRPLYWHYPHYHGGGATPYSAVRDGDYRLIEFFETGKIEMYNLKDDPKELHDLSHSEQEKAALLHKNLDSWRKRVGAQLPLPNIAFGARAKPETCAAAD